MNLFAALQDPAATKMRQAVRLFAEALLELAAEPEVAQETASEAAPAADPIAEAVSISERLQDLAAKSRAAPIVKAAKAKRGKTEEKLPLLRQLAGTMPVKELEAAVGLRKSTLYRLAKEHDLQLGLVENGLKIDLDELRRLAPDMTVLALAARFGCTDGAIRLAAKAHGIALMRAPHGGRRSAVTWTDAMLATLKAKAGRVPATELMAELGVNRNPLFLKARSLGLSLAMAWTPERSAELGRLAGTMGAAQLAAHFHVTLYSLAGEAERLGLRLGQGEPTPAPKRPKPARRVTEVGAAIDAIPSLLTPGGWVEQPAAAAAAVVESTAVPERETPVLEGISYTITTPDRSPPSPELVEALQPVVEAAVAVMRGEAPPAVAPVEPVPEQAARLERLRDEQAGRSIAAFEPLPVARRQPLRKATAPVRRGPVDPPSKWVRLQHPDGRWLRMDGLGWVTDKANAYQVLRTKLDAVLKAFPLARECKVVSVAAWSPKDILYAETVR